MELVEQRLHVGVALDVDVPERVPVPGEELLQAERRRGVPRADDDRVAVPAREEPHAPQDERAHEDLAELGVGLHERAELRVLDAQARAGAAARARTSERRRCEHAHLAGELAGPVDRDGLLDRSARMDDLDLAFEDDEERDVLVPLVEEELAGSNAPRLSVREIRPRMRRGERGKHLGAAGRRDPSSSTSPRLRHHPCDKT